MRKITLILFSIGLFIGCSSVNEPSISINTKEDKHESQSLEQGIAIVEFSDDMAAMIEESTANGGIVTKSSELNNILELLGASSIERRFPDAGEFEPRHREAGLHKWYIVTYDPSTSITKAETSIKDVPGVIHVETPRKKKSTSYFNDPMAKYQWGFSNDGSLGSFFSPGCDINVEFVWDNYTAGSNNVIVAVIDAGVQLNHVDLTAATIKDDGEGSRSFIGRRTKVTPDDHGTHVAGIIGAVNNNNIGVMGVAGGYDERGGVRIMNCEIIADDPNDPKNTLNGDEAQAFVWAADHGAVIANNSWGYDYENEEDARNGYLPRSTKQGIDYFITYAGIDVNGNQTGPMRGGVVFFAAGNENWGYGYPASYDKVIAVGSVAGNFSKADYSNYGDWVDICAPGGSKTTNGSILSTTKSDQYGYMNGTSMACPYVSGVAALIVSYFGKEGFTNEDLKKRLFNGANTDVISPKYNIGGLVDAAASFKEPSNIAPDPVKDFQVTANGNNLTFSWKVTPDKDDKKASGYKVVVGKSRQEVSAYDGDDASQNLFINTFMSSGKSVGDSMTGTISGLEFNQTYYTKIIAFDPSRNYSSSAIKEAKTLNNNPPIITCTSGDQLFKIKATGSLQLEFKINDPDGHKVSASYSSATRGEAFGARGETYIVRIDGLMINPGNYKSVLKATDEYGMSSTFDINFTILENHAPSIIKDMDNILLVGTDQMIDLNSNEYFHDVDGDDLYYKVTCSNNDIIDFTQNGNKILFKSKNIGRTECVITASDARDASVTQKIMIVVRRPNSEIEFYPNPVKDFLNISTGEKAEESDITITSETGKLMYSERLSSSVFAPARVDMSNFDSGLYRINVKISGKEYNSTITKTR